MNAFHNVFLSKGVINYCAENSSQRACLLRSLVRPDCKCERTEAHVPATYVVFIQVTYVSTSFTCEAFVAIDVCGLFGYGCRLFSGSSFAWVNQGTSRRNIMLPHGLSSEPSVRNANLIAIRTCLLVEVAIIIGTDVLVEQPDHHGAGLLFLARWQQLITRHALTKSLCLQGCYQADTPKPTALISNHTKFILKNQLSAADQQRIQEKDKALVVKKRDVQGKVKITGRREILKSTQCYTREFGQAIIGAWRKPCDSWFNNVGVPSECSCHLLSSTSNVYIICKCSKNKYII